VLGFSLLWPLLVAFPGPLQTAEATVQGSDNRFNAPPESVLSRDVWYKTSGTVAGPPAPRLQSDQYPVVLGESRLIIWILAQQHLYWGGFVLGVLLIVTVLEIRGLSPRDDENGRFYSSVALEMLGLIILALSFTAILGALLLVGLLALYPELTKYLFAVFRSTLLGYGVLVFVFSVLTFVYYYTWPRGSSVAFRWMHGSLGVVVNAVGITLMFLANAWSSFMVSPAGVDEEGRYLGNVWQTVHTATWNAFNLHRFVGNLMLGAAVMAAYAGYRALNAKTLEDKAYFDRIGYVAFLFLSFALFTVPFGGYWLLRELYAYRQQMGITLLGGLLAWLGVILVSLIAVLFVGINYYLYQRIDGVERGRYGHYAKYSFFVLTLCFVVYVTPHTMVMTGAELQAMQGQQHPVLGNYGVESAKSTAVNIMIVVTAWSLLLWWRSSSPQSERRRRASRLLIAAYVVGAINILWLGIYGYYIPANVRVGLSLPMFITAMTLVFLTVVVTRPQRESATSRPGWGSLSSRGYYALIFLAFVVTWIAGLGGYRRSSVKLFWHINEIMRDNSPWAFTHTIGFAANVISMNALLFWLGLAGLLGLSGFMARPPRDARK
jgi:hypothetical protein